MRKPKACAHHHAFSGHPGHWVCVLCTGLMPVNFNPMEHKEKLLASGKFVRADRTKAGLIIPKEAQ